MMPSPVAILLGEQKTIREKTRQKHYLQTKLFITPTKIFKIKNMRETIQQIYLVFSRSFLHLLTTGVIYLLINRYFALSKISFLLMAIPTVALMEYFQYTNRVIDTAGKITVVRDSILIVVSVVAIILLYIFKKYIPKDALILSATGIIVLLWALSGIMDHFKTSGQHLSYKHFIDVAAYLLGPFIAYPLLVKIFKF